MRINFFSYPAFFQAVATGDLETVVQCIRTGTPVGMTAVNAAHKQALHVACEYKQKIIVEKLLELGADPNAQTDRHFTPLHIAAQQGDSESAWVLIKAGADIHAVTDGGRGTTPLQEAAFRGEVTLITILLIAGAHVDYRDEKCNMTAEDLARQAGHPEAVLALLGYQKAFIERVNRLCMRWLPFFPKDTPQAHYCLTLKNITSAVSSDDYFLKLKIALEAPYDLIKEHVGLLRREVIAAMKQYNADKIWEGRLRTSMTEAAEKKGIHVP